MKHEIQWPFFYQCTRELIDWSYRRKKSVNLVFQKLFSNSICENGATEMVITRKAGISEMVTEEKV